MPSRPHPTRRLQPAPFLKCIPQSHHYRMREFSRGKWMQAMKIQTRKEASAAVLELDGRLTAGRGAASLAETVDTLLERGFMDIVLNLQHVGLADCAGIGQLVNCRCKTRARGGSLKLACPHRRLGELLRLFRLEPVFEVFETERAALDSLAGGYGRAPGLCLGQTPPAAGRLACTMPATRPW